jgi:hypothetical protein
MTAALFYSSFALWERWLARLASPKRSEGGREFEREPHVRLTPEQLADVRLATAKPTAASSQANRK